MQKVSHAFIFLSHGTHLQESACDQMDEVRKMSKIFNGEGTSTN